MPLGKLLGRTLAATGGTGPISTSCRFFVRDAHTNKHFLVDTGSEVSVIPPTVTDRRRSPDALSLTAVNNTSIRTYGQRSLTLNLGLRRSLPWIFIIADVQKPILGADFLRHYGLIIDLHNRKLIDTCTHLHVQGILSTGTSPRPHSAQRMHQTPTTNYCPNSQLSPKSLLLTHQSSTMSPTTSQQLALQFQHDHTVLHPTDSKWLKGSWNTCSN